jgi:CRP/FNR family transcriptional regulator, cyclic AMP receptor protein
MIDTAIFRQINEFRNFTDAELAALNALVRESAYGEGDMIFSEGDESTELYIILKGEIELQIKIAPQLADTTVLIVKPYEIFGELSFVDPKPRAATARCLKKTVVAVIRREDFENLIQSQPGVGLRFYRNVAQLLSEKLRKMNGYLRETLIRALGIEV